MGQQALRRGGGEKFRCRRQKSRRPGLVVVQQLRLPGRGATVWASLRAATALSELCEAATPRAAATRRGVGRRTAGRGVAMAETALSHGTIMHIHELQALGAEAVGKSVRVLGA